jgi:hypothetical protein
MTHDEFLEKWDNTPIDVSSATTIWKALRAVVELHKKKLEPEWSPFKDSCKECRKPYPCRTLQAIQEQLK